MSIDLDSWFMGGAFFFGITSLIYLGAMWRGERKEEGGAPSTLDSLSDRGLVVSLTFWGVLLLWWLVHTGEAGATRLWFGISALIIGLSYRLIQSKINVHSLGGVISALISLLAIFAYHSSSHVSSGHIPSNGEEKSLPLSLMLHIALALGGLAAFAVSAAMSGLYLVVARRLKSKNFLVSSRRLPSLTALDEQNLRFCNCLIKHPL